jgi:putative DNA primase/helicase
MSDIGQKARAVALLALDLGLSPVAPREDGSKAPLADIKVDGEWTWKPYSTTPATRERVLGWFENGRASVGLACGYGDLEAFEFEQLATHAGFLELATEAGLADLIARIRAGYEETTPGGGIHWLYRCRDRKGNTKLAERPDPSDPNKRKTLIETRGAGGFIIIAPSNGRVHPTGGAYRLVSGALGYMAVIEPEEREALWDLARTFDEMPEETKPDPVDMTVSRKGSEFSATGIKPGDDFTERTSWEDILEPFGWVKVFTKGNEAYWRRPGKDRGVSATTGHCKGLKVFTTSTSFETVGTYTKFGAWTLLNHRGDFKTATKALAEQGFGTSINEDGTEHQNPVHKNCKKPSKRTNLDRRLAKRPCTDLGNGERFAARFGTDVRHCHLWHKWLCWDGARWKPDDTATVRQFAKRTVRGIWREASMIDDSEKKKQHAKWWYDSEGQARVEAMLSRASSEPGIPIMPDEMDQDGFLLNVQNGTIDLRTGNLREHRRDDLITRLAPIRYLLGAKCPTWLRVLGEAFAEDAGLIRFWQQLCGICLTGDVSNQILPVLYGAGANGKTTLLTALLESLGPDYACAAPPGLLTLKKGERHPTELAALFGKRLVVDSETA